MVSQRLTRPAGMRIALGHVDELDDRTITFAKQLGLPGVQLHSPGDLRGAPGYWEVDALRAVKGRCDASGLYLEGLENVPRWHMDKILQGAPGRDAQIENYRRTIRNMAAASIHLLGYHFMPTYVWRTDMRSLGRGGAQVTSFDLDRAQKGNALAAYKLSPGAAPVTELSAERLWEAHAYFLDAVLPVAEEVGVRLALHPDDPPVDVALGGAARLFNTPEALARVEARFGASPAWGLDLCLGTVSEMAAPDSVDRVIDHFGPRGKILYVHFRDVRGKVPRFEECFLGEGNYDPVATLRRLRDVGFNGFIIDDHVPAMIGDPDTWSDTSSAAYCSRGRAYQIGVLQGILSAVA